MAILLHFFTFKIFINSESDILDNRNTAWKKKLQRKLKRELQENISWENILFQNFRLLQQNLEINDEILLSGFLIMKKTRVFSENCIIL